MAKRMTQDEKRQAMLEIFNKTKSFFKIQELEKIGSKQGIVENTIKDIVISLVDDDLISSDKIGASNFYWGNHNKKRHFKMIECLKLIENKKELKESILNLKEILRKEIELKPMTEEKKFNLNKLKEKEVNLEKQNEKLKGFTNLSPKEIGELRNRSKGLSKEINELTDNLFVLQVTYVINLKWKKRILMRRLRYHRHDYVE
ncbi:Meiotic nuclear division protein 1 [Nosema bombycis CQ1]|uniref:Meiotic nuclear division protein 1 n=1 Tax=Nosema bombycis (strain CQ1 / CVCC 102059) TaxID=578461 RepID=R0MM22_NOSB1|nr:Meiotic nuclear division protein 1 [Nosema bombycis CQ1]|eukprot:EOB15285.1 Meiotic nuclear division protein 1 [Nosema bombycis CQ1]